MKCKKCNTENPDEMKFCAGCGTKLDTAEASVPKVGGRCPMILKALRILYMLAAAVVILLFISLSKYDTEVKKLWDACDGHCVEIGVEVTSPLTWVTDYEIDAFNYNPPCSYTRKNAWLPVHEPLTDANIDKFVKIAVSKYKEKVWANIAFFGVVTLLFYGLFYYYNKKNNNPVAA